MTSFVIFESAAEATEIINNMLDEKLELTVKSIATLHHNTTSNDLIKLSHEYNVDEVNIYNKHGEIYASNKPQNMGWKSYEGHPTYIFLTGYKKIWAEDIRKDSLSDLYYKYGYYKTNDGCFVQIGILSDKYYNLIQAFEIDNLLMNLDEFSYIISAHFIDDSLNITTHNYMDEIYDFNLDKSKIDSIANKREYFSKTKYRNEDAYEVILPIVYGNNKVGALAIAFSLSDTIKYIQLGSIIGVAVLMVIFSVIASMLVKINKRNNKLFYLAYHDSLTGFPNKDYLMEFLKDSINKKSVAKAILLVNLINFKLIYLTYGHEEGEIIFNKIAQEIKASLSKKEQVFRITDNEFIIYTENYKSKEYLIELCINIKSIFISKSKTLQIHNNIDAKIGIVEIDNSSSHIHADNILKNAEIAASSYFTESNTFYNFFNKDMEQNILRENYIESELKKAIYNEMNNIIYLEYQPQLNLKTNKISGFEGLARMKTEDLGQISPFEFINIAEKRNLIVPLGLILLKNACSFIKYIEELGFNHVTVAVNVSTVQILRDDFYDNVMKIIKDIGIQPSHLELEITESSFMDNFDIVNSNIMNLKNTGIKFSIDDFGTGYSSLSRIEELNIDTIKIDKWFIDKLTTPNQGITSDIISLAHKLGLNTVAEGVELQEQREYLEKHDCDIMQGYLFSKPISHDNALNILKNFEI